MQDVIETLKTAAITKRIRKHTILYYQGEIPRSAYIVRSGLIKVYSITTTGEERVVALHAAGDLLPIPWLFGETSNTLFYYETVADCELLSISRDTLLDTLQRQPALKDKIFKYLINKYTGLMLRVTALEQSRAAEKIGFTLYYLLFHYGKETAPGKYTIEMKLTQPMIANLVGLARETTAINLNSLKRRGIVNYQNYTYTVDKSKLERFLGEDSFKDLVES